FDPEPRRVRAPAQPIHLIGARGQLPVREGGLYPVEAVLAGDALLHAHQEGTALESHHRLSPGLGAVELSLAEPEQERLASGILHPPGLGQPQERCAVAAASSSGSAASRPRPSCRPSMYASGTAITRKCGANAAVTRPRSRSVIALEKTTSLSWRSCATTSSWRMANSPAASGIPISR